MTHTRTFPTCGLPLTALPLLEELSDGLLSPYLLIVPLKEWTFLPADVTHSATVQIHSQSCRVLAMKPPPRNSKWQPRRLPSPAPLVHAAIPAALCLPGQCPGHRPAHPWLSCLGTTVSATHLPDTPHPPGSPWPARIPLTFPAPVLGPVWPRAYEAPGRGRQIKIDAQSAGAGGAPSQGPVTKANGRASVGHTVGLVSALQ